VSLYRTQFIRVHFLNSRNIFPKKFVDLYVIKLALTEVPPTAHRFLAVGVHTLIENHLCCVDGSLDYVPFLLVLDVGQAHNYLKELVSIQIAFR